MYISGKNKKEIKKKVSKRDQQTMPGHGAGKRETDENPPEEKSYTSIPRAIKISEVTAVGDRGKIEPDG